MNFNLSPFFIKKEKRKIILVSCFFLILGSTATYSSITEPDLMFIVGLFLLWLAFNHFKQLKYWNNFQNKILLEINEDYISVQDTNEKRSIKTNSVEKAVLQLIHGKIKSIVLHISESDIIKLEGFETMDNVAEHLQLTLGESKIEKAKFFHR